MAVEVLYVHHNGAMSGSAISLRNLLLALDRNTYHPRVLLASDGPARQLYESLGIPVDVTSISAFWTSPGSYWYSRGFYENFKAIIPNRALERYLKELKPDLVHINDKAMLSAGIEARRLGLPVIWHLRSSYFPSHSRFQAWLSARIIRRTADRLIAISEDEVDGFQDLPQLQIIYNSVDLKQSDNALRRRVEVRKEFGFKPDQVVIGTVSTSIGEIRGTWDFLRAAGLAKRLIPERDLRFVIVAAIPEHTLKRKGLRERLGLTHAIHPEDQAWQLAREGDISSQLTLTGFRKDSLDLMAAMDIMVVCNRHGVLGRMPFEAMSVGCPVVARSGHSGRSQVVRNGETALIVPLGDLQALAEAIVRLVRNPELRRKMGERGRLYSQDHFDPQRNARKVEQAYQELLAETKGS